MLERAALTAPGHSPRDARDGAWGYWVRVGSGGRSAAGGAGERARSAVPVCGRQARAAPLWTQKAPRPAGRGHAGRPEVPGVEGLGPGFERSARGASGTGRGAGWASQPGSESPAGAGRSTTPFCGPGLPQAAWGPRLRRRRCLTCEPRRGAVTTELPGIFSHAP